MTTCDLKKQQIEAIAIIKSKGWNLEDFVDELTVCPFMGISQFEVETKLPFYFQKEIDEYKGVYDTINAYISPTIQEQKDLIVNYMKYRFLDEKYNKLKSNYGL